MEEIADEVHKPIRRRKDYIHVITYNPNDIWGGDIVEMGNYIHENNGYKYILVVIDIYSRYAWTVKMKTKSAKETTEAMKSIVEDAGTVPNAFWVDEGKEFNNKELSNVLKDVSIYSTYGEGKSAYVERLNRTLKAIMYKKFTVQQNHRWLELLPKITKEYNKTVHSRIQHTPYDVYHGNVEIPTVINGLSNEKPKFNVGDRVRISYKRRPVFDKSYLPNWTWELFTISKVKMTNPFSYKIKDSEGEIIKGSFYENELQLTNQKEGHYLVEKILGTKKIKGKEYSHVKWLGYEKPTWELSSNVKNFDIMK